MPFQKSVPRNPELSYHDTHVTNELVHNLISIGAIKAVHEDPNQFISPIFPVPKQNGKFRLVVNMKELNNFINTEHFKMEDWRTVISLMHKNMYLAKIDLKDAYHLIAIGPNTKKFLRFNWNTITYEYQCLPFGLSLAPLIFTKLMKEVVKTLRENGHLSSIYLDDILLLGDNKDSCNLNVSSTVKHLEKLGFLISEKSVLVPQQCIEYLGMVFNTIDMTVSLPVKKIVKIKSLSSKLLVTGTFKIREIAEYLGTLTAACPGVQNGPLYTKQLELEKSAMLKLNKGNYESSMCLSDEARHDIKWWIANAEKANPIKSSHYDMIIFSDASLLAWGASCNGLSAKGKWTNVESKFHINSLELLAAEYALKTFAAEVSSKSILLRLDNKTAIAYINRQGGCRSEACHAIAKRMLQWCIIKNLRLHATYIKSKDNIVADSLSRKNDYFSEWMLGKRYFLRICSMFGQPEMDLFASYNNHQCEKYCSWLPDPNCYKADAFSFSWNEGILYAFPPFAMVGKVLQKIRDENATVIVVAPNWSTQAWYPYYIKMAISKIVYLGPNKNLLKCPYSSQSHPMKTLQLMTATLSGKLFCQKD